MNWAQIVIAALAGGGVAAVFAWLTSRTKLRESEVVDAGKLREELLQVINFQQAEIAGLKVRIGILEDDLKATRQERQKLAQDENFLKLQNIDQQRAIDVAGKKIDDLKEAVHAVKTEGIPPEVVAVAIREAVAGASDAIRKAEP